jgi:hypothetical protein
MGKYSKGVDNMANWTHKLNIADLHDKYDDGDGDITIQDMGKEVAKRIRSLIKNNLPRIPEYLLNEAEIIAEGFDSDVETVEDYDRYLADLYDWGDTTIGHSPHFSQTPKLCWINTL